MSTPEHLLDAIDAARQEQQTERDYWLNTIAALMRLRGRFLAMDGDQRAAERRLKRALRYVEEANLKTRPKDLLSWKTPRPEA